MRHGPGQLALAWTEVTRGCSTRILLSAGQIHREGGIVAEVVQPVMFLDIYIAHPHPELPSCIKKDHKRT